MRFDLSSAAVLAAAVASALATAWCMDQAGLRGQAHAAVPVYAPASGEPARILRAPDGHYWAEAEIDGTAVRLMVDTGASVVALTRADAARLGLRLAADDFTAEITTASGVVGAAPVRLRSVSVAGTRVDTVEALVVEQGLPHSLLGMSYLGRLSAFSATRSGLTLQP